MSEVNNSIPSEGKEERFNKVAAVLIALVTTMIALVTFLQSDASNRDDRANRDTKRYSMEAMERKISGDARTNYDYNKAYQAYYEYDLLALSAEAEEDPAAMERYITLRNRMKSLSPLLASPYFDEETGEPNIAKYESDTYVVETTALMERFSAASSVKDAWDSKANSYIVHLTLLAVALFLYGMATTISGLMTRWIFSGVGSVIAIVAVLWAGITFAKPVPDLRNCVTEGGVNAIDAFSEGVGLSYQNLNEEAIASFDLALSCQPDYANALAERGNANMALGNIKEASADFESALSAGDKTANTSGELAWAYYLLGDFNNAIQMNRKALSITPDEYWIQFDLALSLLASGDIDGAKTEYAKGMDLASKQVAEAKAAGAEPPSYLWWGLDDAAISLEDLMDVIESGQGNPPPANISNTNLVSPEAEKLIAQLRSLAVALEYTGLPPAGELSAVIGPFTFAEPIVDEETGEITDYAESESFAYGIWEIAILFDYQNMQDGQEVLYKVYIDGEEDPSWRLTSPWDLGQTGSVEKMLSLAYSNTAVFDPGQYTVEMYVDNHLAQRGYFIVEGE